MGITDEPIRRTCSPTDSVNWPEMENEEDRDRAEVAVDPRAKIVRMGLAVWSAGSEAIENRESVSLSMPEKNGCEGKKVRGKGKGGMRKVPIAFLPLGGVAPSQFS